MAGNTFNVVDWLTMEGLDDLMNELGITEYFNTDYNNNFTKPWAVGDTVRIPLPQRWNVTDGLGWNPQPLDRPYTTVAFGQPFGIHFEVDSLEAALRTERGRDQLKKLYLKPAMKQLAQEIESRAAQWAYQNTPNIVGVMASDPTTLTPSAQARQQLKELACPPGEMGLFIAPAVNTSLVPAFATYFQPAEAIGKQYKDGIIGRAQGFDWSESVSLYKHTAGTWAGAVTASSAQVGNSIALTCTTGDTFKKGDVVAFANVNPVNPSTRRVVGTNTRRFVVTADVTGAAAAATIPIYPSIVSSGHYQNVDAGIANGAALTLFPGTSSPNGKTGTQGLALHKNAFAMVSLPLEIPQACEMSSIQRDPDSGVALAFVRMFDPIQRRMVNRFDCLIGFGNLYPEYCAVRYISA